MIELEQEDVFQAIQNTDQMLRALDPRRAPLRLYDRRWVKNLLLKVFIELCFDQISQNTTWEDISRATNVLYLQFAAYYVSDQFEGPPAVFTDRELEAIALEARRAISLFGELIARFNVYLTNVALEDFELFEFDDFQLFLIEGNNEQLARDITSGNLFPNLHSLFYSLMANAIIYWID